MNWGGEIGVWEARQEAGVKMGEDRAVRMESRGQGRELGSRDRA